MALCRGGLACLGAAAGARMRAPLGSGQARMPVCDFRVISSGPAMLITNPRELNPIRNSILLLTP